MEKLKQRRPYVLSWLKPFPEGGAWTHLYQALAHLCLLAPALYWARISPKVYKAWVSMCLAGHASLFSHKDRFLEVLRHGCTEKYLGRWACVCE